jgi:hypothetical protein
LTPVSFQSKAKTGLVIAILVSQTLYLNLVIEVIPATSITLPLLGRSATRAELAIRVTRGQSYDFENALACYNDGVVAVHLKVENNQF